MNPLIAATIANLEENLDIASITQLYQEMLAEAEEAKKDNNTELLKDILLDILIIRDCIKRTFKKRFGREVPSDVMGN